MFGRATMASRSDKPNGAHTTKPRLPRRTPTLDAVVGQVEIASSVERGVETAPEARLIPKMDPSLSVAVHHRPDPPKPCRHLLFNPLLRLGGEIIRVEIHQVVILNAIGRRETVLQIPDRLGTRAGPQIPSREPHLASHGQDCLGNGILCQRVVLQVFRLPVKG